MDAEDERELQNEAGNIAEADVCLFLDNYFKALESNLKHNNFDKINTKLLKEIIDKFETLFILWDENKILRDIIHKGVFENIHKWMSDTLDDDNDGRNYVDVSQDVSLKCNNCGINFTLRNNNVNYSYNLHCSSEEHLRFIETMNESMTEAECSPKDGEVGVFDPNDQLFITSRCNACDRTLTLGNPLAQENMDVFLITLSQHLLTPRHTEKSKVYRDNKQFVRKSDAGDCFICEVCWVVIQPLELWSHFENDNHLKNVGSFDPARCSKSKLFPSDGGSDSDVEEVSVPQDYQNPGSSGRATLDDDFVSVFDAKCIIFKDGKFRCKICTDVSFSSEVNYLSHIKGKKHKGRVKLCESNSTLLEIDGPTFRCTLCNYYVDILRLLFNHCSKKSHEKKFKSLQIKPPASSDFHERATEFPCFLCEIKFRTCLTFFRHFKSVHYTRLA